MDIGYILRRAARMYPHSTAVDDGRTSRSMAELVGRGERVANALDDRGVPTGASVGVLASNCTESVEADAAIALGRRVRVALNARLHLEDFRYVAEDAELRALFFSAEFAADAAALAAEFDLVAIALDTASARHVPGCLVLEDLVVTGGGRVRRRATDPESTAWISYTSGTTGRPKGVELSHRAVREVAVNLLIELAPVQPGEQLVLTQAISHGSGYFVLPYLMSGAGVFVQRRFDPEQIWELSRRDNVHTLKAVPAMLEPILAVDSGDWGFDRIVYGASSIPLPVLECAVDRFGATLLQDYGQSEAPITITCLSPEDHLDPAVRLSAGRPWRTVAVEVRGDDGQPAPIDELGEVYVRGEHLMSGYLGRPEETAEVFCDGWLRTKDLAVVDERGYVHLRGRRDEMIVSGGYNIAPREVEDVLAGHSEVAEAVVLGMPDQRWGEMVTAVVRPRVGTEVTEADVMDFARPRLGIRTPKRVVLWSDIPRNAYGKVDRARIRSELEVEAAR